MAHGRKTGGGSRKGRPNKRTLDGQAYARAIVEDPQGRGRLLTDFQQGTLPPPILLYLLQMAYGKPYEVIPNAGSADTTPTLYTLTPVQVQGNGHAVSAPGAAGHAVPRPEAL